MGLARKALGFASELFEQDLPFVHFTGRLPLPTEIRNTFLSVCDGCELQRGFTAF
jgi:hypothetical protein